MQKIDVVIPTKKIQNIRPKLLTVLEESPYVNFPPVIDTTPSLAKSRKVGASKCTTEWIAEIDDDVEISPDWFEAVFSKIRPGVVAVSSMVEEQNPHMRAYFDFIYRFKRHPELIETANVNAVLIRRDAFDDYDPPAIFCCEDNMLYNHVTKKGKWLHILGHAKHWMIFRKSNVEAGRNTRRYHLATKKSVIKNAVYRFLIPPILIYKTHSLKTIYYFWRWDLQWIWGYLTP